MRTRVVVLVCLMLAVVSCKRDAILDGNEVGPSPQGLQMALAVPSYSQSEFLSLLADTDNEVALTSKSELVTYVVTRLISVYSDIEEGPELSSVFPCDFQIDISGNNLREMSGLEDATLEVLDGYVADCITDLEMSETGIFLSLLESMELLNVSYTLYSKYDEDGYTGSQDDKVFISYGIIWDGEDYRALGFEWDLVDGGIVWDDKTYSQASDMVTVLLHLTGSEGDYINDPCHYVGGTSTGGGNWNGTGGSGSGYDDDGNEKRAWNGSMVLPPPNPGACSSPSGLKIAELHLATRNEGGLFSGKSEVYVNTTFYGIDNSGNVSNVSAGINNPCPTCSPFQTNSSTSSNTVGTWGNVTYNLGKMIGDVPSANISNSSNGTSFVHWEGSICCAAANGDWTLLEEGFCDDFENGYNRVLITVYERDRGQPAFAWENQDLDLGTGFDIKHYCQETNSSDCWLYRTITPNQLAANGGFIYIFGGPGITNFGTSTTQPSANFSWAKLELF